jgi:phosphomannomutase
MAPLKLTMGQVDEGIKELQNGSDIRGYAVDTPGGRPVSLTDDRVRRIAFGFANLIKKKSKSGDKRLTVAVGMDSRISGPRVKDALVEGLVAAGCDVVDVGLGTTPAMFKSTVLPDFMTDAGIMITASHLPFDRNGLKFFLSTGGLGSADITEILQVAHLAVFEDQKVADTKGTTTKKDLLSAYSEDLVSMIRKGVGAGDTPLKGIKILVDAGNGCGGFFVDKVLHPLGADTTGSQFLEPDGMFPNHIPNPEDSTAMKMTRAAVLKHKADLGVIFDTDVDRAGAVDASGEEINRNRLIAMASAIVLGEHPGTTIVTDSVTSNGLTDFIEGIGGKHHRYKRGYKNVIEEAIRLSAEGEASFLAMETSGHGAQADNAWLDDGAYTVVKILIEMAKLRLENKGLMSLIDGLKEPKESVEVRLNLLNKDSFGEDGKKILAAFTEYAKTKEGWEIVTPNFEGVRIQAGSTWMLLRLSLHDPLMPLNIESQKRGGTLEAALELEDFLEQFAGVGGGEKLLDIRPLVQMTELASGEEECELPEDEPPVGWSCVISALQEENGALKRKVAELEKMMAMAK